MTSTPNARACVVFDEQRPGDGAGLMDLYRLVEHDWRQEAPGWWRCGRCQMLLDGEDAPSNSRTCYEWVVTAEVALKGDFVELWRRMTVERDTLRAERDQLLGEVAKWARGERTSADHLDALGDLIEANDERDRLRAEVVALRGTLTEIRAWVTETFAADPKPAGFGFVLAEGLRQVGRLAKEALAVPAGFGRAAGILAPWPEGETPTETIRRLRDEEG